MSVSFVQPLYLLLIPLVLGLLILIKPKRTVTKAMYVIRSIVFIMLILSLSGLTLKGYTHKITTILAVDLSNSMLDTKEKILDFIKKGYSTTVPDSVGIVCFGSEAKVESMPTDKDFIPTLNSILPSDFTNIDSGLKMSGTILPEYTKKRIILFSDGEENAGDALTQAKLLKEQGIELNIVPISTVLNQEVQISSINIPKYIKKSTKYPIEINSYALSETNGQLFIYRDNTLIAKENVTLRQGENKFIFNDIVDNSGSVIYRAEILADKDSFHQNNKLHAYSYVEGEPSILLIGEDIGELSKILNTNQLNLVTKKPQEVSEDIQELNRYDAIILANTPINSLPENFPSALETHIKNSGAGFIVTGGENAYALGDYYDTPLETLLPVEMQLKDKDDKSNLGMVLVIDRSGSMGMGNYGVSKLEMAKEAIIRSVDNLKPEDSLGVIAFDSEFSWASDFITVGENHQTIKDNIANISLGGGTSILPGLTEAYDVLSTANTKLKHIILLTDGQAEQEGYNSLIEKMKNNGITLSTVAVGSDSDITLLKKLSSMGNGRYYFTSEFTDLPKIFIKETMLASRNYIINENFNPIANYNSKILEDIEGLPQLSGYVATTAKASADVIMHRVTEQSITDPILATWQYGLGRTIAWTSDLSGKWTKDWLATPEGVKVVRNMVSWVMRKQDSSEANFTTRVSGNQTEIQVNLPYSQDIQSIAATVYTRDGRTHNLNFEATAPGEYKAILLENKQDAYIVNMEINKIGTTQQFTTGLSIPYSPEYEIRNKEKGLQLLQSMAQANGGNIITNLDSLFATLKQSYNNFLENDISNLLLTLSLLIFILDVAARRFPDFIKFRRIAKKPGTNNVKKGESPKIKVKTNKTANNSNKDTESANENLSSVLLINKKKRTGR